MKLLILSDFAPTENLILSEEFKLIIDHADYVLLNLEGSPNFKSLTNSKNQILKFRSDCFFDFTNHFGNSKFIISLANNHILDNGHKPFQYFKNELKIRGIKHLGTREKKYLEIDENTVIYSFATITTGLKTMDFLILNTLFCNETRIINEIELLLLKFKIVIVYPHWGIDLNSTKQNPYQKLQSFLIHHPRVYLFGHHPHLISGVESVSKIFSLGNTYIPHPTYYKRYPDTRYGIAVMFSYDEVKLYLSEVYMNENCMLLDIKKNDISYIKQNSSIKTNKQHFEFSNSKVKNFINLIMIFILSSLTSSYIYRKLRKRI